MVKLAYTWIDPKTTWFRQPVTVRMGTAIEGGQIRYSLDGSVPTADSPQCTAALTLKRTTPLKAATFVGNRQIGDVVPVEFVRLPR